MSKVIIYLQDNGVLAIITPVPDALQRYSIEQIALKDVPTGKPFKIIDSADLPTDKSMRAAWTVDESLLTDGVGAEWSSFSEVQQ